MNKSVNLLFIFMFICPFIVSLQCPNTPVRGTPGKATIYYVVDDYLDSFQINGNEIIIPENQKSVDVALGVIQVNLRHEDRLTFKVRNINQTWENGNPAFLLATIEFYDRNGVLQRYNTNESWKLVEGQLEVLGQNKDFCPASYWKNKKPFNDIELNAKMLWRADHQTTAVFTFQIPCK